MWASINLETFREPSLDLMSGVVVGSRFLGLAGLFVSPKILYQYYQMIMDSLSFGRENFSGGIHEVLRKHIVQALPTLTVNKQRLISQLFRILTNQASPPK